MHRIAIFVLSFLISNCQTPQTPPSKTTRPDKSESSKPALRMVEMPKLGLILGPGAFKTWAHLGVLRELEKFGFRIHAIVGMEWGALIGGIYSQKGRANDLEWQLSKMKKSDLPHDGVFGPNYQPATIKSMGKYFDTVFQQTRIENGAIPFACSSVLLKNGKITWWEEGPIRPAIEKCMTYPPLYSSQNGWVAAAFDVGEAVKKLREKGAEIIVLVNVLARGSVLKENRVRNQDENEIIWWKVTHDLNTVQTGLDWIIGVHTRNYDILDFEARPSFVLFGQEFGAVAGKKIAEQYGL